MLEDHGLRKTVKPGHPVTLVLGAGVNRDRGLPLWPELLRGTWQAVFGEDPYARDADLLQRARHACLSEGLPTDFVDRLDIRRHPFELQFAFDQVFDRLRWLANDPSVRKRLGLRRRTRGRDPYPTSNEQEASELFTELLRKVLYRGQPRRPGTTTKPTDTLSLIAQAVRRSARSPEHQRLIAQVITFNVDDLLEREVNAGCRRGIPYALPIARASAVRPLPTRRAIAIYHLHGFIPMTSYPHVMEDGSIDKVPLPNESLVFTDEQYWRTVGNPAGFASRVFAGALSGRCVFIGLSMTDVNIIRWLAQDAIERSDDFRRLTSRWPDPTEVEFNVFEDLSRHYWITQGQAEQHVSESPAAAKVLQNTLSRRGVISIEIPSWDSKRVREWKQFRQWWHACFLS